GFWNTIPTRRRSCIALTPEWYTSCPSSSTFPVIQPPSVNSCMRFRVRRKVDLPQPEGPINALTLLLAKVSVTFFTAVNLPYIAVSLSVPSRTCCSGMEPPPRGEASTHTKHEDHQDQNQRRGPGQLVPLFISARRVLEDHERQRGHRLVDIEVHVLAAQRGEQERGRFTRDTGHGQQTACHDPRESVA